MRRSERIAVLTKILNDNPQQLFSLSYFAEMLEAAKSTVSEDLTLIKNTFKEFGLGEIISVAGATGGVKYQPLYTKGKILGLLVELAHKLVEPERIIPGGFLYMADLIYSPAAANKIGEVFATIFLKKEPEYVVTVATKGIPLALATAKALNVPLVIIRDDSKVTEGSSVSLNYVTGSSRRIRTMSLSRRALSAGAKVLFIDDFMKAGGTARGVKELTEEFGAKVVATGVLVETVEPREKLIDDYLALLALEEVNEKAKRVNIHPAEWLADFSG